MAVTALVGVDFLGDGWLERLGLGDGVNGGWEWLLGQQVVGSNGDGCLGRWLGLRVMELGVWMMEDGLE